MPWFKVDDKLHDHRKTRAAGLEAMGLWVTAGSWAADNLTDGFVPASVAARWSKTYERLAARLVTAGLWVEAEQHGEPGWAFHDWHERQPLRERVLREREAAKERMAKARNRSGERRENFARGSDNPDPTRPPFLTEGEGRSRCQTCAGKRWVIAEDTPCPTCSRDARVIDFPNQQETA